MLIPGIDRERVQGKGDKARGKEAGAKGKLRGYF
jgi:hypothetical protein